MTKIMRSKVRGQYIRVFTRVVLKIIQILILFMQNFIELKTSSIHPIFTPQGWLCVIVPLSVVECFTFFLDDNSAERGEFLHTTLYLN